MADIHIDDFFKDTANVLVRLYQVFPRKATLYVEDIAGPDNPDEYGVHSARHMACFSAMLWLADEGYLRFEEHIRQDGLDQACLTQAAFLALNYPHTGILAEDSSYLDVYSQSHIVGLRYSLQMKDSNQLTRQMLILLQRFKELSCD